MTQEEKDLLLKYLCMAQPYGVIGKYWWKNMTPWDRELSGSLCDELKNSWSSNGDSNFLPYLRSMLSMTKEELREYNNLYAERENNNEFDDIKQYFDLINWLLEHHFDFIGLLPKGIAIEVTKENNPYKN